MAKKTTKKLTGFKIVDERIAIQPARRFKGCSLLAGYNEVYSKGI